MQFNFLEVIKNEDKKNPYTDEEIAAMLGTTREQIVKYRKENDIPNSRERRKEQIYKDAIGILKKRENMSEREFTRELRYLGYDIGRYAAANIRKKLVDWEIHQRKYKGLETMVNGDIFENIIGCNGSLKTQINQAKAAVLYPPKGLHTLLLGPSGVGKSYIAEAMYNFAKGTRNFSEKAPFMVFNCADYADNPQLLLSQLFGYCKGAFTGASEDKKGMVEISDGGILFLDEVHRLTPEGQEMLFYLLDKGKFRRLGETEISRESHIMIIAATTENPDSSLLATFKRRIPMVIRIPSLSERPYIERFNFIKTFFFEESIRLGRDILVEKDVIKSLMSYNCQGNIGQLKSDIQVACARSFLSATLSNEQVVTIRFQNLADYVKDGMMAYNYENKELESLTSDSIIVSSKGVKRYTLSNDRYVLSKDIYQFIEDNYLELKKMGYNDTNINEILGSEVERELMRFISSIKTEPSVSKDELLSIVGEDILRLSEKIVKVAEKYINNLQPSIFYPLAIHLGSVYERIINGKEIINPNTEKIRKEYKYEYKVAKKIAEVVKENLKILLPEEEICFIAMYLKNFQYNNKKEQKGRVAVLVLSHGKVACGMAEVANKLLGVEHAVGLEMNFNDSVNVMLEKTIQTVESIDEGKGCIILSDMGSLLTFDSIIMERTGIATKTIGRVDTLMVLEAVRKAILPESTLDDIVSIVTEDKKFLGNAKKNKTKVIVTLCITGEGSAIKIKKHIENLLKDEIDGIEIIPLGFINQEETDSIIKKISINKEILCIVGNIDPEYKNIPFISSKDIISNKGIWELKKLIKNKRIFKNELPKVIKEDLIFPEINVKFKDEVLDMMVEKMIMAGYVGEEFLLSVYKRESMQVTYLEGGIAIPHGDIRFIKKPAISVAKLANPLSWDGVNDVDLIFLIALHEESRKYFEQLYKLISTKRVLNRLRKAYTRKEIQDILFASTL